MTAPSNVVELKFEPEIGEHEAAAKLHMHYKTLQGVRLNRLIAYFDKGRKATYSLRQLMDYQRTRGAGYPCEIQDRVSVLDRFERFSEDYKDCRNPGYIYFAQCRDTIKIGFSRGHPDARLRAFQTGNPDPVTLIAVIPSCMSVEKAIHHHLKAYTLSGEWFQAAPEVMAWVRILPEVTRRG